MASGSPGERTLKDTPTWAVALWFHKRRKKAMSEALEKIKAELMLLGFISLLLTVGTKYVTKICIPAKIGDTMLPCKFGNGKEDEEDDGGNNRRKLLSLAENDIWRRVLAPAKEEYCSKYGKVPLITYSGLHQLHIFIFVLAVFHILYSVVTIVLAKAKMKKWKSWESETSSLEYQFTNDPARFRFTHQTSFVKRHSGFSTTPGIRWIVAFFRQFFGSVTKVDYLTMRQGFINAHFAPNSKFDFHKYVKRSMEDDFKVVVGVRMILLLVGTKLELIIMEMAQEIQERTTVVKGALVVEPSNKYFWFNRPEWILFLIHFTLFQNAFQMAYFLWICYEFGPTSCFHENLPAILTRVFLGVALQILCSYITFPLYALVTQMGSHMKKAIFEEQTAKALKKWQKAAKERKKQRKRGGGGDGSNSGFISGENTPSHGTSPLHLLHNHKYRSNHNHSDIESVMNSPRSYQSDTDLDLSEIEGSPPHDQADHGSSPPNLHQHSLAVLTINNGINEPQSHDFSFVKP
ncbi:hypothetical protein FEM48_Zijuj06G0005200 [Ziziphus jujuba var. spinosa]|uniref:MLO-like protein n=1 Tax=Ziziphus jujuba var. spinosa TaxID=714518 RepID=A0A978V649_ZIZJJ|nr:hypothetical protein FEM48_Zijuj06G0005200 [Ziziphus jujuba var. spinosa]